MIHIGERIKEKVFERKFSLGEFAKAINKSRPLVYDIFERKSIDTALLQKISVVLEFNFFSLYIPAQATGSTLQENATVEELSEKLKSNQQALELARMENDYLKKINSLLESQLKK